MLRALRGKSNPAHVRAYVVTVSGYFGDMDESFNVEVSSSKSSEEKVEAVYRAYLYLKDNWAEAKQELPEEHQDHISGASWDDDILPSSDLYIKLEYYDELGNPNDVEVLDDR